MKYKPSSQSHVEVEALVAQSLSSDMSNSAPPITEWELSAAVESLNAEAAPGLDGLSASLVQACFPLIKLQLLFIMNACFSLCLFPISWKVAKVRIIGKLLKASYDCLNSFRPISLINTLAKVLEKILLGRLLWLSNQQDWISKNQHGFLAGKSTETAGRALVEFISTGFESKQPTACAFLDIKSAFDSAWHPAILMALLKRKCPLYLTRMISSFLTNRNAVISHGTENLQVKLSLGCPQGGVLSPFLWNVVLDDVLRLVFPFDYLLIAYADDLAVAARHKAIHCNPTPTNYL